MELRMYLGSTVVDAVAINRELIAKPGYLGAFKRELKVRHHDLLQQTNELPEFLLEARTTGAARVVAPVQQQETCNL